jgi:hypothetical protein
VKPLDIPCGVCHQVTGMPCIRIGDKPGPHAVRVAAAKRNGQPPVPSWLKGKV